MPSLRGRTALGSQTPGPAKHSSYKNVWLERDAAQPSNNNPANATFAVLRRNNRARTIVPSPPGARPCRIRRQARKLGRLPRRPPGFRGRDVSSGRAGKRQTQHLRYCAGTRAPSARWLGGCFGGAAGRGCQARRGPAQGALWSLCLRLRAGNWANPRFAVLRRCGWWAAMMARTPAKRSFAVLRRNNGPASSGQPLPLVDHELLLRLAAATISYPFPPVSSPPGPGGAESVLG